MMNTFQATTTLTPTEGRCSKESGHRRVTNLVRQGGNELQDESADEVQAVQPAKQSTQQHGAESCLQAEVGMAACSSFFALNCLAR